MAEEREQAAQEEDSGGAGAPFDDDPPVDTSEPQVGNSKAKFFVPRDEETGRRRRDTEWERATSSGLAAVTYLLVARLPAGGVAAFEEYERRVLALLPVHGGRLARRLRSADRLVEVHLVEFPSTEAFATYRDDPRRGAQAELLEASGAATELLELYEASVSG